jgi:rhamnogalacturonyl hydrolase YesR
MGSKVILLMILFLGLGAPVLSQDPSKKPSETRVILKLKDGSFFTGTLEGIKSLEVITDFGSLIVPLERILSIRRAEPGKEPKYELATDVFTIKKARIVLKELALKTKYGQLDIPLTDIEEISIFSGELGSINPLGLELARKAVTWLKSKARHEGNGWAWPVSSRDPHLRPSSIATIGTLFLRMHELTKDAKYLQMAEKVGNWFIHKVVKERGGYKWLHPDRDIPRGGWSLSCVVAEVGEFLIKMYKTTEEEKWLQYAEGAGKWLLASAVKDGEGSYVPYNTPRQAAHGMSPAREAHTTLFLLNLWKLTKKEKYLTLVKRMATWLIEHAEEEEEGELCWKHDIPYRNNYPLGGMADIAIFFYELYESIKDKEYLEHANGALRWLISQADNNKVMKWSRMPGTEDWIVFHDSRSHMRYGTMGEAFLKGYLLTKERKFLEVTKKYAAWVRGLLDKTREGLRCPQQEGKEVFSPFVGSTVYRFMRKLAKATNQEAYEHTAQGILKWLSNFAKEANGGIYWEGSTERAIFNYGDHGVAGIALNLLAR